MTAGAGAGAAALANGVAELSISVVVDRVADIAHGGGGISTHCRRGHTDVWQDGHSWGGCSSGLGDRGHSWGRSW